ncbi:hypothetical protein [uncultured Draconibacterium sp.]|uniref:hypothetical protein n=1 Tax=uncultured Draconibacterium sp. TaxID=1573823 RepID=UPI0025EA03C4|nr:hypothetical protein [uncultured Draconibacterium sp.]
MNKLALILFATILWMYAKSQDFDRQEYWNSLRYDTISLDEVYYGRVNLHPKKQELTFCLGEPDSIVNPHYECGGFSEDWQEQEFLQYYYKSLNFIGTDDNYIIEHIDFKADTTINLNYKGKNLNHRTSLTDIRTYFPKSFDNRFVVDEPKQNYIFYLFPQLISDDKIMLMFENGLLVKLEYYSPC